MFDHIDTITIDMPNLSLTKNSKYCYILMSDALANSQFNRYKKIDMLFKSDTF